MYSIARKLLFLLDPETSHELSLDLIGAAERLRLIKPFCPTPKYEPVEVMGINFPNPVGLAAGLDKNGDYFNGLGEMGFGFVEIGTVTPKPQPGNPKPRLFRLPEQQAIINRMGFNNKGVEHLVENVKARRYQGVLGINIGKNKATPEENALDDYRFCMERVYAHADYITINISSPNTPGLRDLQFGEAFDHLLSGLKETQGALAAEHGKRVPIAVKIAPDMNEDELAQVAGKLLEYEIDGVIATNTTIGRAGVESSKHKDEAGGLSGVPVTELSTETIRRLATHLDGKIPIIGVGGIIDGATAQAKLDAGASLVQIYSGFIYKGPSLIHEILNR
ncbi:MAG: quinone-dependent dihydroorotate dehydrogenase [Agarilytica sp.]